MIEDFRHLDLHHIFLNAPYDKKPQWGILTLHHMAEHLAFALQLSNGKAHADVYTSPEKLDQAREILLSDQPLGKLIKSKLIPENQLVPLKTNTLEEAVNNIYKEIHDFEEHFKENPDDQPNHPRFGPLTYNEWVTFHNKHFTHHLNQFKLHQITL